MAGRKYGPTYPRVRRGAGLPRSVRVRPTLPLAEPSRDTLISLLFFLRSLGLCSALARTERPFEVGWDLP